MGSSTQRLRATKRGSLVAAAAGALMLLAAPGIAGATPVSAFAKLRRGSVLLILRIGNIDLEAPNSPGINAPPAWDACGLGENAGRVTTRPNA